MGERGLRMSLIMMQTIIIMGKVLKTCLIVLILSNIIIRISMFVFFTLCTLFTLLYTLPAQMADPGNKKNYLVVKSIIFFFK